MPVERHRGRAERAADLAHDGGAYDPVVAVGVVGGDLPELVPGELGGLGVVRGGLVRGGVAGQRAQFQQQPGGGRAVQVAVGDDGAVVGAAGAAVGWVQVLDQLRPGLARAGWPRPRRRGGRSRSRPGCRRAGCRPRASRVSTGTRARAGSAWQEHDGHPPGQLGDGRAVLLAHHGGGGQVVAEEQLAVLAGAAAGAVSPGGLGVGAVAGAVRRRAGEGLHVGPVHRQRRAGVLVLAGDAGLQQVVADPRRGSPRGCRRGRPWPGRR